MAPTTVLIVDDDRGFVEALALFLQKHGYCTRSAYNGGEGRQLLAGGDVRVVILDVHLPDVDGVELLAGLVPAGPAPAVILISADDSRETERRCAHSGAAAFLVKPIAPRELLTLVGTCMQRAS